MRFLLLQLLLLLPLAFNTQDTILKVTGEEILAKIIGFSPEEVQFKKSGFEEGPTYILPLREIFMIKTNGRKYVYQEHLENGNIPSGLTSEQLYRLGQTHAAEQYESLGDLALAGLTSCAVPYIAIPGFIIISMEEPKVRDGEWPNEELSKEEMYRKGYIKKKKELRNRSYLTGAGVGALFWAVIISVAVLW